MQAAKAVDVANGEMLQKEFWQREFPELSINSYFSSGPFDVKKAGTEEVELAATLVKKEGYFQQHDDGLKALAAKLSAAVKKLVSMKLPPAFIFLFDESWACFYRQHLTIAHLIGTNYFVLPDFWAWHVDHTTQEAGWKPHRDKGKKALDKNGMPLSLTMWIPLTESTPLNGCIYILPADRDPVYNTAEEDKWQIDHPSIRALPASPGEVLCWNQALLHWGSRSNPRATNARISMALEFQRGDILPYNTPLLITLSDIPFGARLKLVAKQILQYDHMYALSPELKSFAQKVLG